MTGPHGGEPAGMSCQGDQRVQTGSVVGVLGALGLGGDPSF